MFRITSGNLSIEQESREEKEMPPRWNVCRRDALYIAGKGAVKIFDSQRHRISTAGGTAPVLGL